MASDIKNTSNGTTGNQKLGGVVVNTPGMSADNNTIKKYSPPDVEQIAVDDIDEKYDARFDEPRYYTGDAAT